MADVLRRRRAQEAAEEEARLRRRSQVLQRDLPRPVQLSAPVPRPSLPVSIASASSSSDMDVAEEDDEAVRRAELRSASALVAEEMVRLLASDAAQYPLPGAAPPRKAAPLEPLADQELQSARVLVHRELAGLLAALPAGFAERRADLFAATWERVHQRLLYSASRRTWVSSELLTPAEQAAALKTEWAALVDLAASQARANAKTEAKLRTLLQGYAVRADKSSQGLDAGYGALDEAAVQLSCFRVLLDQEAQAIPTRLHALRRDLTLAGEHEKELQQRYADRLREQEALMRQLRQLEQAEQTQQGQQPPALQTSFVRASA
jgi:pre-mRNA-splicing factor CDC5/CEF1